MAEVLEGDLNADGVVNFKDEEIAALNRRKQDLADAKAAAIAKKAAGEAPQGPQLGLTPLQERQRATALAYARGVEIAQRRGDLAPECGGV